MQLRDVAERDSPRPVRQQQHDGRRGPTDGAKLNLPAVAIKQRAGRVMIAAAPLPNDSPQAGQRNPQMRTRRPIGNVDRHVHLHGQVVGLALGRMVVPVVVFNDAAGKAVAADHFHKGPGLACVSGDSLRSQRIARFGSSNACPFSLGWAEVSCHSLIRPAAT